MKISALTTSGPDAASSRLRSYYLFHPAARQGVTIIRQGRLSEVLSADVLHVQKVLSPKAALLALVFRLGGKRVIYDVDDQPSCFRVGSTPLGRAIIWLAFVVMFFLSNHVTVDTPERARYWRRFGFRHVSVIPDAIDLEPTESLPDLSAAPHRVDRLVWIGYGANLPSIHPLIKRLGHDEHVRLQIITDPRTLTSVLPSWPWIEGIPWSRDVLFSGAFQGAAMVLNHDWGHEDSLMKSENKMVLAIAAGLVPIISDTAAYARLAGELGASRLVFTSVEDATGIAASLDAKWVAEFLLRARAFIVENYSPEANWRRLQDLLR